MNGAGKREGDEEAEKASEIIQNNRGNVFRDKLYRGIYVSKYIFTYTLNN